MRQASWALMSITLSSKDCSLREISSLRSRLFKLERIEIQKLGV